MVMIVNVEDHKNSKYRDSNRKKFWEELFACFSSALHNRIENDAPTIILFLCVYSLPNNQAVA
jgi:hypothetical protein